MRSVHKPVHNTVSPRGSRPRAWVWAVLVALACGAAVPCTISQDSAQGAPQAAAAAANRPSAEPTQPPASAYAGDGACAPCHQKESEFYEQTPHARDSAPASAQTIDGSFAPGENVLHTTNPNLIVAMTSDANGFYQSAINISDPSHPTGEVERFDIVIGSGRHAQTYLYWSGDLLYELPISYWQWNHKWIISPGFPAGEVHFERAVVPRCLECHGSYFKSAAPPLNRYVKDSLVLGIGCERCHGPGAEHVARERSATPPAAGSAQEAIVNPARLSHDRQIDLCALCHAGAVEPIRPPLTFIAGDNVRDFLAIKPPEPNAPVDVHGNQVGALEASKCFTSGKLLCSTCHNVHQTQENADAFSSRCLTCHEVRACPRYAVLGDAIRPRCIDCHMPLQDSAKIKSDLNGQTLHALLRAHKIGIYPEAAAEVERTLGGK